MEYRKKNISVRLSESDIKRTKEASNRLGVKESELFRFGVKIMLRKLTPLNEGDLKGVDLIPAWLEWGDELAEYFDLDIEQLDLIFNHGVEESQRVDASDFDLMMLSRLNGSYIVKKLSEKLGRKIEADQARQELKNYLFEKYVNHRTLSDAREQKSYPGNSLLTTLNRSEFSSTF